MAWNKIKWKHFSSLANHLFSSRRSEINCLLKICRFSQELCKLSLEGKTESHIRFPLKSFSKYFHCVPISQRERKNKLRVERLFMFLEDECQLHYGNKWINTIRKSLGVSVSFPTKAFKLTRHSNFFFSGEKKRQQTFLKSKLKTWNNFYFICFLFSLICVSLLCLIYWFIIFFCKVYRLNFSLL